MIYLDNAATTPMCDAAKQTMLKHLNDFGNPSSSYEFGRKSRLLIEDARATIARCINAEPDEIYFTSGGSESNTWALNNYISVSTNFEHHSVKANYDSIEVNANGFVDLDLFASSSYQPSQLPNIASCMYINNEIGTIQPIKEVAQIAHSKGMLFHTDAVQALGHIPVDVKELDCDMLSGSAHKFGGKKGVGFLWLKTGVNINSLIHGGNQEKGLRAGTENILGISSMSAAIEDAVVNMEERNKHIQKLRDKMLGKLLQIDGAHLNGPIDNRVVSNINIRFDGILGSRLVTLCDLYDICISAGSACNEGTATPSHVLKAIGLSDEEALSSIRVTIGHQNTEQDIDQASGIITKLIERIRNEEV